MSFSKLATVFVKSPNRDKVRTNKVIYITPHCMVGQMTAKSCGVLFARSSYCASSNYGIGKDGEIGGYVDEEDRSWCSSSAWNDNRAITIECASDTTHPYAMNHKVWDSLVDLCFDICQRYGKKKLIWFNDKRTTLNYKPASDEMVLTVHRWYAAKSCPGDWLYGRLGKLADTVTDMLSSVGPAIDKKVEEKPNTAVTIPDEDARASYIWSFLKSKGLNDYAVAGLMGNLYWESALRPNNLQNSYEKKFGMTDKSYTNAVNNSSYFDFVYDSAGYGLAQWTYWSRKQALLYFAKARKASIDDLVMQLEFLWEELQNYTSVMKTLNKARSVKEASNAVLTGYEKPADQSESAKRKRAAIGQEYFDKFSAKSKATKATSYGYFVQFGAFGSKKNAEKRLEEVKGKGLNGKIEKFDGYYRVFDGYFTTLSEANDVAVKSRKVGFKVIVKERTK